MDFDLPMYIIYALRVTIVAARMLLWLSFSSGAINIQVSPHDDMLFGLAFMITMHGMYDAGYVTACTADLGGDPNFSDAAHLFITLVDVEMAKVIRRHILEPVGDPDE